MDSLTFLRQFRIGPFAVFDTVLGFIGVLILSPVLSKLFSLFHVKIPWTSWLWWMFPLSVVFHAIFKQSTPLMKAVTSFQPLGFLLIVVLLGMFAMGLRNCSVIKSR